MYGIEIRTHLDETFKELAKNNPRQMKLLASRLDAMVEQPRVYQGLHFPFVGKGRVHIGSSVLLFSVDDEKQTVVLEDYEHHDEIYMTR